MTTFDAFNDPKAVASLLQRIETEASELSRRATFMEVCGTHTHAVAAAGLRRLLDARCA